MVALVENSKIAGMTEQCFKRTFPFSVTCNAT